MNKVFVVIDQWRMDIEDGVGVVGVYTKREDAEECVRAWKKEALDDKGVEYEKNEWDDGSYSGWNENDGDFTSITIMPSDIDRQGRE